MESPIITTSAADPARVGSVSDAECPAFRAPDGHPLHWQRLVAYAERAPAFQGGDRAVEIAGEARDAHAEHADGKHHVEGMLLPELSRPAAPLSCVADYVTVTSWPARAPGGGTTDPR
jgi:hypothetical protein